MCYDKAPKSMENVTNAVLRLPKYLWQKLYGDFKIIYDNEEEINLELFLDWWGERTYDINDPLTLIVEAEIKTKQASKDHQKTTKEKYQKLPKEHYRSFAITTDTEDDTNAEAQKNVKCWLCHEIIKFQAVKF